MRAFCLAALLALPGTLTAQQWGILAYRHTDHHLRQFGA